MESAFEFGNGGCKKDRGWDRAASSRITHACNNRAQVEEIPAGIDENKGVGALALWKGKKTGHSLIICAPTTVLFARAMPPS
jgi:hypothetical protein